MASLYKHTMHDIGVAILNHIAAAIRAGDAVETECWLDAYTAHLRARATLASISDGDDDDGLKIQFKIPPPPPTPPITPTP